MAVQLNEDGPKDAPDRPAVLLVDDLPEKLLVLRTVLEGLNAQIVLARSGRDALREVLRRDFAVVLLDVNMPDIDGFETASMIRRYKRSAHTPIIFVTAYVDDMQTAQGYSLGAVDYIVSPVVPDILRSKVKVFLDLHEAQRRVREQAEERLALVTAQAAQQAAEATMRRLGFLSQASRLLGGSLEEGSPERELLGLLKRQIGGLSAVATLDEPGGPARVLLDRGKGDLLAIEEHALHDLPTALAAPLLEAIGSRQTVELALLPRRALAAAVATEREFESAVVLPLTAGKHLHGALLVAAWQRSDEWDTLEEVAHRLSMALENARLYRSLGTEIEERRQAERRLQESNRRKDEFLAMLSHELRNPLAPIRNATEVIRRSANRDPKLEWAGDVMARQIEQMRRLVDELLDVARINQGKVTLQLETLDLRNVLAHGLETVRPAMEARRHVLQQSLPDHGVWMRGDFARLSQVVANLLGNAAKYTDDGGRIQLSLSVQSGEAVVRVRDNGIGIDADLLPRVFDLFEQGQRGLDRSQGGLGVGLTLAQRLVAMHDGRIDAFSAGVGQGTEFIVRLPCLAEVSGGEETSPPLEAKLPAQAGCRVLVVDDNRDSAQSAAVYLELAGHDVRTACDGQEALGIAATHAPQVVVLDIGLPGLDGYQVASRLRAMPATRASMLIALTGYGTERDRERAREAGFDLHLVKPADPAEIASAIEQRRAAPERAAAVPAGAQRPA